MTIEKLCKSEQYFFYFFLLLNLLPVFSVKFFPTVDSPAHLYNANIINELLFKKSPISSFFILNSEIIPNWISHIVLSFFSLFLPGFIAEKVLLTLYLLALPVSFRSLVKVISPGNYYLSYIIFPLSYSTLLLLGFYNFSIALIFMFFTLSVYIRNEEDKKSGKRFAGMFFLFLLTYFSHIFVFIILISAISSVLLLNFVVKVIRSNSSFPKVITEYFRKILFVILAAIIPLILFAAYYFPRQSGNLFPVYQSYSKLLLMLKDFHAVIMYNINLEEKYSKKLAYITLALLLIAIYQRIKLIISKPNTENNKIAAIIRNSIQPTDSWLLMALMVLFLVFKMPDSNTMGGFVSIRLSLLFFMMLFLWLSTQKISIPVSAFFAGLILILHFLLMNFNIASLRELNKIAIDCNNASGYIRPFSTVLPINCSENWLHVHYSNYIGIDKPIVVLENYECEVGYFPVKWNEKELPDLVLGDLHSYQLNGIRWRSNIRNKLTPIDYIFVLDNLDIRVDSNSNKVRNIIDKQYIKIYQNASCKLYEYRKTTGANF